MTIFLWRWVVFLLIFVYQKILFFFDCLVVCLYYLVVNLYNRFLVNDDSKYLYEFCLVIGFSLKFFLYMNIFILYYKILKNKFAIIYQNPYKATKIPI